MAYDSMFLHHYGSLWQSNHKCYEKGLVNLCFSFAFLQEFNLIDRKELVPLQELIEKLTTKDR